MNTLLMMITFTKVITHYLLVLLSFLQNGNEFSLFEWWMAFIVRFMCFLQNSFVPEHTKIVQNQPFLLEEKFWNVSNWIWHVWDCTWFSWDCIWLVLDWILHALNLVLQMFYLVLHALNAVLHGFYGMLHEMRGIVNFVCLQKLLFTLCFLCFFFVNLVVKLLTVIVVEMK